MAGSDSSQGQRPTDSSLKRIEGWSWRLILPGLVGLVLGIFLLRGAADGEALGAVLASLGGVAVLAGIVLIYLRSRWA